MKNFAKFSFLTLSAMTGFHAFAQSYSGGSGTTGDPYLIANKADLKYLSEHSGEWSKHFSQTSDIIFSAADFQSGGDFYNGGSGFIPIGTLTANFDGNYNGNQHLISNLEIHRPGQDYVGFFGFCSGNKIEKLALINVTIEGGNYVGGFCGHHWAWFDNCYVTGVVSGTSKVGGFCGSVEEFGYITKSYSTVSVSGSSNVGGLCGNASGGASDYCFYDAMSSGQSSSVLGTAKTTTEMQTQSTFNNAHWDFVGETTNGTADIWKMDLGCPYNGYPIFAAQSTQARPTITASNPAASCGTGTFDLAATASAGTLNWYSAATAGSLLGSGTTYTTPSISTATTYYVEANDGGCLSASRTAVLAITGTCTQLRPGYCGTTLAAFNQYLCCDAVSGATAYRFEISDGTNTYYYTSGTVGIRLNLVPGIKYGTTYNIRAAAQVGGNWLGYGTSCSITTPLTALQSWYCGLTLTDMSDYMACDPVQGATQYKFEVSEGANVYTYTSSSTGFRMSLISNLKYNTTYSVRVAAKVGGSFSAYGAACNVTTPLTKMQTWYCGITVSPMSQYLACFAVNGATQYRFKLFDGTNTLYFTSVSGGLRLSLVPGIQTNTTYDVSVASYVGGSWSAYGTACSITSAATMSAMQQDDEVVIAASENLMQDLSIEAYPNPNDGNFTIRSTQEGSFNLMNELGQVIRTVEFTKENNLSVRIEHLNLGVYLIGGIINNQVITQKIIVK